MATTFHTRFYFQSKSPNIPADTFRVVRFKGEEEISQPFRFEIELVSEDPEVSLAEVLCQPAMLTMERDDRRRNIHGILSEFELIREGADDLFYYRGVLMPRLWLMSLSRQNQIYQNMTVPQIVEAELKGDHAKGHLKNAASGLMSDDFEMRLTRSYPVREYVVQYKESDLNFISRLMEHEGIFYYFVHGPECEKLIITDNNLHFANLDLQEKVPFRPPSGMATYVEEAIQTLACRQQRIPRKVILKDYNYRLPHIPLQGEAEALNDGHGLISDYGDNFKLPEEGTLLARIRAEEIRCRQEIFNGSGDCNSFQSGFRYQLEDHFRPDFNSEYIITRVRHEGGQHQAGTSGIGPAPDTGPTYRNEFHCIRSEVAFRPPRRTPKPRIYGILNAHVDTAILEERAEIDAEGRYKIVMPFDLSGSNRGRASRFVRMAQPYGGGNQGMHFPLHRGTEVIWTCIDGDPDRPIIVGSVPNPLNPSVVTQANHAKNVIRTASGATIELYDGPGTRGITQSSGNGGRLAEQQQLQPLSYRSTHRWQRPDADSTPPAEPSPHEDDNSRAELARQQNQDLVQKHVDNLPTDTSNQGSYLKLHVPPAMRDNGMRPPQPIDPAGSTYTDHPETIDANTQIEAYVRYGANISDDTPPGGWRAGGKPGYEPGDDLFGYIHKVEVEDAAGNKTLNDQWVDGLFDGFIDNVDHDDEGNPTRTNQESIQNFRKGVVWRDHVSGNRLTTTQGDKVEIITGNYRQLICNGHVSLDAVDGTHRLGIDAPGNPSYKWVQGGAIGRGDQWGETEITRDGYSVNDYQGYEKNIFDGLQVNQFKGIMMNSLETIETSVGTRTAVGYKALNLDVNYDLIDVNYKGGFEWNVRSGIRLESHAEWNYHFGYEGDFSDVKGNKYSFSSEEDIIAQRGITLQVNKNIEKVREKFHNWKALLSALGLTMIPPINFITPFFAEKVSKLIEGYIKTATKAGKHPTIDMTEKKIKIQFGKQRIELTEKGITLNGKIKVKGTFDQTKAEVIPPAPPEVPEAQDMSESSSY